MKPRGFKIVLMCFILFSTVLFTKYDVSALAEQIFITIKVNGDIIKMDALPYTKEGRTFVPVRVIAEALNADVEWNREEQKVLITDNNKTIELFVGSNEIIIDGEKELMDARVETLNGRTMVPVRYIAESLDCTIDWDQWTYSVLINKENVQVSPEYIANRPYTDDDIIWLSRIISVEGRGLSIDAKLAIANVVLNRKNSPGYPNTVKDVIFDKAYCIQFPPAHKESFKSFMPTGKCVVAAKMALEGMNNVDRCLFFNNVPFPGKSKDLYKIIDGEYFYY